MSKLLTSKHFTLVPLAKNAKHFCQGCYFNNKKHCSFMKHPNYKELKTFPNCNTDFKIYKRNTVPNN